MKPNAHLSPNDPPTSKPLLRRPTYLFASSCLIPIAFAYLACLYYANPLILSKHSSACILTVTLASSLLPYSMSRGHEKGPTDHSPPSNVRGKRVGDPKPDPHHAASAKILALDCEMVGLSRSRSSLSRVSIVGEKGDVLLDLFVRQSERVVDYRTRFSGCTRELLEKGNGETPCVGFKEARGRALSILAGCVCVVHDGRGTGRR